MRVLVCKWCSVRLVFLLVVYFWISFCVVVVGLTATYMIWFPSSWRLMQVLSQAFKLWLLIYSLDLWGEWVSWPANWTHSSKRYERSDLLFVLMMADGQLQATIYLYNLSDISQTSLEFVTIWSVATMCAFSQIHRICGTCGICGLLEWIHSNSLIPPQQFASAICLVWVSAQIRGDSNELISCRQIYHTNVAHWFDIFKSAGFLIVRHVLKD